MLRTVVTFKSLAFDSSEAKEYFINPGCFGDDVATWLSQQLRDHGYEVATEPDQEDFGWYFTFRVSDIEHCFVIGCRAQREIGDALWIGWLERSRGLVASLLGARNRGIQPAAVQAVHEVLSASSQIREIGWHFKKDFDAGREDQWVREPLGPENDTA
jgi:hypothetical protein